MDNHADIANVEIYFYHNQFTQVRNSIYFTLLSYVPKMTSDNYNVNLRVILDHEEVINALFNLNRDIAYGLDVCQVDSFKNIKILLDMIL